MKAQIDEDVMAERSERRRDYPNILEEIRTIKEDVGILNRIHDLELQTLKLTTIIGAQTQVIQEFKHDIDGNGDKAGLKTDLDRIKEKLNTHKETNVWAISFISSIISTVMAALIIHFLK